MFLPTTRLEMDNLGWDQADVILISGDTYIDSYYNGTAVVGKVLMKNGYKTAVIAQPDINSDVDIKRLGEPRLFWGVSAGAVDSMVANYTATRKKRRKDDFTPGGENNRRPDRACITYTNLIKRYFKDTVPIALGGIEASLRRIVHYDFWTDKLRKSILFNAKADYLMYGMSDKTIIDFAYALNNGDDPRNIRGLSYIAKEKPEKYIELPAYEEVMKSKDKFIEMFNEFYLNNDPKTAKGLCQKQDTRYLVQNPPQEYLSEKELDEVYSLDYERDVHPYYKKQGEVRGLEIIKDSVTSHRGCYGECNFCAIAVHQGRTVRGRSQESIIEEVEKISSKKSFKGYISDVGGATANMYGIECDKKIKSGVCDDKRCLYPVKCKALKKDHSKQIALLRKLREIKNIKKIFIASGVRYDLVMQDNDCGEIYLQELIENHISGQMKIAPEHTEENVLAVMGKPKKELLTKFKNKFDEINQKLEKKQFLTYYLIAAHPGCNENDMVNLKKFASKELRINPEQVQIFTPTPSTYSTLMYYTEKDPFTGKKIFVEKDINKKERQKNVIVEKRVKGGRR